MKCFIKKIIIFCTLLVLLLSIQVIFQCFVIGNQYGTNYQAGILDKMERLESINEPKIVLVGNSNLAFGMCSELLEEELQMPVVNLGFHAALGNSFHENMAKAAINKNDIIIVCHTDYADDGIISNPSLAWITLEWHKELWKDRLLSEKDYLNMLLAYPDYAVKATQRAVQIRLQGEDAFDSNTSYARSAFNSYGDISYRPELEKYVFDKAGALPGINDICIQRLNSFNAYIKERGAVLLVAAYPVADGAFTADKADFEKFQNQLEEKLDCPVISDFTEYFIPYECFYDNSMHLTKEGAMIRTQKLIKDLKQWLEI